MRRAWIAGCLCAWACVSGAQESPKPAVVHEPPAAKKEPTPENSASPPAAKEPAAKEPVKAAAATKSISQKTPVAKPSTTAATSTASTTKAATSSTTKAKAASTPKTTKTTNTIAPPTAAAPVEPAPVAPAPPPPSAANGGRVVVPSTPHFHVEVPAGLQAWLDADDRMRPWLGKAVSAIDSCYADLRHDNPSASGVITFSVTMHQNARPSGAVGSLPAPLRSLVPCVTSSLWSMRMPLFTGDEGARYDVAAHFDP